MVRRKIVAVTLFLAACNADPAKEDDSAVSVGTGASASESANILFLGTSLTAGLGVGESRAYPAVIQEWIDSLALDYRVINAGVSGETSAGGLRRIDWLLRSPVDVLVLELGANDGLRGLDVDSMKTNLIEIVQSVRAANPKVEIVVAGMEAPPNLGLGYTERFRRVFREVADSIDAALVPFLLDGVGGVSELNQADGIHPTVEGHAVVAENVWRILKPILADSNRGN